MFIAVDFDRVVVEDGPYNDLDRLPRLCPGAREGLFSLKAAGHVLLLYSARANRALREDPDLDPLVRAGVRRVDRAAWEASRALHQARYKQMVAFVEVELPGIFDAVDDGVQGKPEVDLFLDDRAIRYGYGTTALGWPEVSRVYGQPIYASPRSSRRDQGPFPPAVEGLPYSDLLGRWRGLPGVEVETLLETRSGPMISVEVPGPLPTVVVLAGQHGDETGPVLALYQEAWALVEVARSFGVRLVIYPCVNPEGYVNRLHHNLDDEPANTVTEYEVAPGEWAGELRPGQYPLAARESARVSRETRALLDDLRRRGPVWALLDLHQDSIMGPEGPSWFGYAHGRTEAYRPLVWRVEQRHGLRALARTRLANRSWSDVTLTTDEWGLTTLRDGSVTDWAWTSGGARLALCLETAAAGPLRRQMAPAVAWVRVFLEGTAQGASAR